MKRYTELSTNVILLGLVLPAFSIGMDYGNHSISIHTVLKHIGFFALAFVIIPFLIHRISDHFYNKRQKLTEVAE